MEFILRLLRGFLCLRIQGNQIERFVNLCKTREILLRNIRFMNEECLECMMSISDFRKVQKIRRKTRVKIRIIRKCGMPFFFLHHKKRKAFFLGMLCIFFTIWFLSGRIWIIRIEGNLTNTSPEIMKYLEQQNIRHGMKRESVDCAGIAAQMREYFKNITWVSAKLSGSVLTISTKEGVLLEEVYEEKEPCDLIADQSGTIVKMVTRSGVPQKKSGDICEKGDILVKGQVEILNDSMEVVRYEYVCADADVYVRYRIPYYHAVPLVYVVQEETEKQSNGLSLQIGDLFFSAGGSAKEQWARMEEYTRIKITESFYLPVSISKITAKEYTDVEKTYTKEQAEEEALKELHKYEENLIQKGLQIFANNVTIKFNQNLCVCSGYLEVIGKTGIPKTIALQEQPIRKDIEE